MQNPVTFREVMAYEGWATASGTVSRYLTVENLKAIIKLTESLSAFIITLHRLCSAMSVVKHCPLVGRPPPAPAVPFNAAEVSGYSFSYSF